MRWIVSPWTTIENTTTAKVIFRISGFQELSGSDTASASDRPPRRPPHVNSLVKPRQSARIAPTALRPPTIAETVSARAKSTAVIATTAGTPGVTPTRGLIRTTWNPTNTNSRAFSMSSNPVQNVRNGTVVSSLNRGPVMLPLSRPATTVAIGPETWRCWAAAYMHATAPSETSKLVWYVFARSIRRWMTSQPKTPKTAPPSTSRTKIDPAPLQVAELLPIAMPAKMVKRTTATPSLSRDSPSTTVSRFFGKPIFERIARAATGSVAAISAPNSKACESVTVTPRRERPTQANPPVSRHAIAVPANASDSTSHRCSLRLAQRTLTPPRKSMKQSTPLSSVSFRLNDCVSWYSWPTAPDGTKISSTRSATVVRPASSNRPISGCKCT